jgi:DNA-binding NarL/FixJ family response regulator
VATSFDDARLLTSTQRRILHLVSSGRDVHEVAQELFLTPGTVRAELDLLADRR